MQLKPFIETEPRGEEDGESQQRRQALRAMLFLTLAGALLMLYFNLRLGAHVLVGLNLLLLALSVVLLALLSRPRGALNALALAYLAVLFLNIIVGVSRPDIHPGSATWMAVLPVLSYLLLEAPLALPLTLISMAAATASYFLGAELGPYRLDPVQMAHVFTPMLSMFGACHFYARGRRHNIRKMLELATRDPLTGLWNREKLSSELAREARRQRRKGTSLALLLIDLDHFKKLNDRFGHDAGDQALVFVSNLLRERLRDTDLACRIGGEEFAVLLPDTGKAGGLRVAEDLRRALEEARFRYRGEDIAMTLSGGVVELGLDGDDWPQLYRAADALLYQCKARGRNRVMDRMLEGEAWEGPHRDL